jgi:selenide,water dikinase
MPIKVLPGEIIREILRGGEAVCAQAGIPLAGGHSIDSVEPIYGLVALGVVHPDRVKRNADARAGDVLVLGKPLGIGIFSAALKKEALTAADYGAMVETTTQLNVVGPELAQLPGVHAMTDVTGFGLLGHLLEICRGSGKHARVQMSRLPFLDNVVALAEAGFVTGASARNWASYGSDVQLAAGLDEVRKALLCDPQTSGGLLVSCSADGVEGVLETFRRHGFERASIIGSISDGAPGVAVEL